MVFSRSTSPMPKRMCVVAFAIALCAGCFLRTASACPVDDNRPTFEERSSTTICHSIKFSLAPTSALTIASLQKPAVSGKAGPQVSLSGPLTSDSLASVTVTTGSSGGPGQPFSAIIT